MAIQEISLGVVANDGEGDPLREGGEKINQNFTNPLNAASYEVGSEAGKIPRNNDLPEFGTAATANTGTEAGEVPTNGDLGTASTKDTGTGTGQIPTADELSVVGKTNWSSGNVQIEDTGGLRIPRFMKNNSGGTHISGQTGISGSDLQYALGTSLGWGSSAVPVAGTWKQIAGHTIGDQDFAMYVRIA